MQKKGLMRLWKNGLLYGVANKSSENTNISIGKKEICLKIGAITVTVASDPLENMNVIFRFS